MTALSRISLPATAGQALDAAEAQFPDTPLWVLGHSFGGSMLPFHKPRRIERTIVLAAGLVRMRDHPWPYQALVRQFWYLSGPVATQVSGYMPTSRVSVLMFRARAKKIDELLHWRCSR